MRAPDSQTCQPEGPPLLRPDACSVSTAITHLKGYQDIPLDAAQAIAYLRLFDGRRPLHRLYRVYFPLEWACSTASLSSAASGGYSLREAEFLHLVEYRLFPLDGDYLVENAVEEGALDRIELLPYASNWWDMDEIDPAWLRLMLLSGMLHAADALNQLDVREDLPSSLREAMTTVILATRDFYSLQPLRIFCCALTSPLHSLPVLLEMLRYETGNDWLDITGEDGSLPFDGLPLRWCEQDLDFLTHTFRAAQEIEHQAHLLVEWLKVDLDAHTWEMLDPLKRAYVVT